MTPARSNPSNGTPTPDQLRRAVELGARTALGTVLVSTVLALVKITAGVVGNAYALVADGVESITDVFSSLLVLGGLRLSARPSSETFPYGMGKAEALAAATVATIVLAAGVGIAVQAVHEIRIPHETPAPFTLVVLALVVVVKEVTFRVVSARSAATGSSLLGTDAWHHRSDALTSAAAFAGISVALLAGPGYESADDWAALLACAVILWNGGRLLWRAVREALDAAPPREVRDRIARLAGSVPGVLAVEQLRVRKNGLTYLVDIHVEVDREISVWHGHEIAHRVKEALVECELPVLDALVHVEPYPNAAQAASARTARSAEVNTGTPDDASATRRGS
ncbi:MAG: cation diffusion facilitator family transporter [Longimicrobiales bacterium]|nr:cation diffusion facilitator family transporter [Longimicrobiales bacterium]